MRCRCLFAVAFVIACSPAALADPVASFAYTDLSGSYNPGTQTFTARAVNNAMLQTSASTARLVDPMGGATFAPGFVSRGLGNFVLSMSVVSTGPFSASGVGSFTINDLTGDTVSGTINGSWGRAAPGTFFFDGRLSGIQIASTDGRFDGEQGSWDLNLPGGPTYDGAVVRFNLSDPTIFHGAFEDRPVEMTLTIVPPPGVLLGMAGAVMVRRRSRA